MKNELIRKAMLVASAILIGVAVCMSVWFFLRAHKNEPLLAHERITSSNSGLITESGKAPQQGQNSDEEQLNFAESAARGIKSNFMSIYTQEHLATPSMQKMLEMMDSQEFIKYLEKDNRTQRDWNDFLESQGFPVNRNVFSEVFRDEFPTGEPDDYEPEMRLKIAQMFLSIETLDPQDPQQSRLQRAKVVAELMNKEQPERAWFVGQFGEDWDGAIMEADGDIVNNPAFIWMTDVQRNAASIVAAAEAAGDDAPETQTSASSWDMSSVMESPSASHSETEILATPDTSDGATMTDAEIESEIEKSLTSQPREVLPDERPDTPLEIQSELETSLKAQFSSERFERAMSTLDKYGPKEGLRRLRENDPEVAKQVERHRKGEEVSK